MRWLLGIFLFHVLSVHSVVADETAVSAPGAKVQVEKGISTSELAVLLKSDLRPTLDAPAGLGFSSTELKEIAAKAKVIFSTAPVERGDVNKTYDLILQIGHFPRKTGKTGGEGRYINEQQIAAFVAVGMVQKLAKLKVDGKSISVLLIPADDYNPGLKTKVFLSLHTDSSQTGCSVGPSVGYEANKDRKGMHGIALALAITLGIDAEKFMQDNYTRNLSGYYAYRTINAEYFKGLLEMSELSCQTQEDNLLGNAALLSANLATAVQFALR